MRRWFPDERGSWSGGLALLLGALLLAAAGAALARQQLAPPAAPAAPMYRATEKPRFYITKDNVFPTAAPASCAAGYHMASLWEILDPSGLTYARDVPAAKVHADQGTGPVAGYWGWVRTATAASVSETAGLGNCNLWRSREVEDFGTVVKLADEWTAPAVAISPWQAMAWSCYDFAPVWCVSNLVYRVYLPVVVNGG